MGFKSFSILLIASVVFLVYPINDPISSTLKDYELKPKDVSENKVSELESNSKSANGFEYQSFIGPILAHINQRAIQIPENIIKQNQVDLISILSMKKFQNYKAGSPTKVCYLIYINLFLFL